MGAILLPSYLLNGLVTNVQALGGIIESLANGSGVLEPGFGDGVQLSQSSSVADLKPRVLEVLALMAQGCSNYAIAEKLSIRPKTVENYINYIYQVMDLAHNDHISPRVQAVLNYLHYASGGHVNGSASSNGGLARKGENSRMILDIDEKDLKSGVLGLVVALVEIIKETLRLQALRRMEAGSLTPEEVERLGEALMDLDSAIEKIKVEMGLVQSVQAVRDGLDRAVGDAIDGLMHSDQRTTRSVA